MVASESVEINLGYDVRACAFSYVIESTIAASETMMKLEEEVMDA